MYCVPESRDGIVAAGDRRIGGVADRLHLVDAEAAAVVAAAPDRRRVSAHEHRRRPPKPMARITSDAITS